MSDLAFKAKITKTKFEDKLVEDFGNENLTSRQYQEENRDGSGGFNSMTLYYVDGVHFGTWQTGDGWIFNHAYDGSASTVNSI